MRGISAWATVGLLTVLVAACAKSGSSGWVELKTESGAGPALKLAGTVHRLDIEGGVWVIRDAQGTNYQPTNLPDAFRIEGMPVEAEARRRDNLVSIGMAGTLIDVIRIRQRTGAAGAALEIKGAPQPAAALPAAAGPTSGLVGIWTVVGHHIPAISAMNDADARTRYGRTIRITETLASADGNHCDRPTYSSRTVAADRFLADEFNLPPKSLAPVASMDRFTVLETSCGGAKWTAMGARLIGIAPDRSLAPWDGVFFELARDRDVRALGQEPFWHLEIRKGLELRFTYAPGDRVVVTPDPGAQISANGMRTYHARTEANNLRVVLAPHACTDVMSAKPFPNTVTVTLNGQTYHGCGGPQTP